MGAIAGISLLVGGIGIMNIMLVRTKTRRESMQRWTRFSLKSTSPRAGTIS